MFLAGADRDKLDPILDTCVAVYVEKLDEDGQVGFKGKAGHHGRVPVGDTVAALDLQCKPLSARSSAPTTGRLLAISSIRATASSCPS